MGEVNYSGQCHVCGNILTSVTGKKQQSYRKKCPGREPTPLSGNGTCSTPTACHTLCSLGEQAHQQQRCLGDTSQSPHSRIMPHGFAITSGLPGSGWTSGFLSFLDPRAVFLGPKHFCPKPRMISSWDLQDTTCSKPGSTSGLSKLDSWAPSPEFLAWNIWQGARGF